jgi:hypothetical protein
MASPDCPEAAYALPRSKRTPAALGATWRQAARHTHLHQRRRHLDRPRVVTGGSQLPQRVHLNNRRRRGGDLALRALASDGTPPSPPVA